MTRKMLKEEFEVRKWYVGCDRKHFLEDVTTLVRAVREEDARTVETMCCGDNAGTVCGICGSYAAAIRGKK
jgi:hypothetical protein